MSEAEPTLAVEDAPERQRFEITVDGRLAGICEYHLSDDLISLTHIEVFDSYAGRGLAATLVRSVLDTCRSRGLRVEPLCPYVASYIERHSEYADLVAG